MAEERKEPNPRLWDLRVDESLPSRGWPQGVTGVGSDPDGGSDSFTREEVVEAAVELAVWGRKENIPDSLRQSLLSQAEWFCSGSPPSGAPGTRHPSSDPTSPRCPWIGRLGWMAAVAATVLALASWSPRSLLGVRKPEPASPAQRALLLSGEDGTQVLPWEASRDPVARFAAGEVIWREEGDLGYLRIHGLSANDPSDHQYQLWVFDATREDADPVDGGVFDIPSETGDVVIPIRPSLPIGRASLFAVTVEEPGGVDVSRRERIVLLASPPPA